MVTYVKPVHWPVIYLGDATILKTQKVPFALFIAFILSLEKHQNGELCPVISIFLL
jgi:hypothetical protein